MKYEFPLITNISDVLPAIEGRKEFIVANRGDYTILNYAVAFADTFPEVTSDHEAMLRECRGITFRNSDGMIIRRTLHKFFNVGERDETNPAIIDELMSEAYSLEKLDGSMIAPFCVTPDNVRWGTKMGETDVAQMLTPFLEENYNYIRFAREMIANKWTPIFEFCSRKQRIVIDYPEDRLVLLAIRHLYTGEYVSFGDLVRVADDWRIDRVQTLTFDRLAKNVEGVIIRLKDGHMAKMKTESYLRIHKAKDKISVEKNAVDAILNNEIDDLLPELGQEDRDRVNRLSDALHEFLDIRSQHLALDVAQDIAMYGDKKTYALECQRPQYLKAATFKLWEDTVTVAAAYDYLLAQLTKSLGREVNYADFKRAWGFTYDYGASYED